METNNNHQIFIEAYEVKGKATGTRSLASGGKTKVIEQSAAEIGGALDVISEVADKVEKSLAKMDHKPEEVQIKLGVKLTTEAGVLIAKASGEGNFEITITWKRVNEKALTT